MYEEDERLVQQAQGGDRQAFAALVEKHTRLVYSLCLRMVANSADAEDLTQETFLRLFSSLGQYRLGSGLRPWLCRIAINRCLDALRKKRRRLQMVPLDGGSSAQSEELNRPSDEPSPERAYVRWEQRQAVLEAVSSLPPEYRAVVVLRYQEDMAYQEIAAALGVPVTTVETRLFRAKRMLRPMLDGYVQSSCTRDVQLSGKEARKYGMQA